MKNKRFLLVVLILICGLTNSLLAQDIVVNYRCGQPEDEINKIKPQFIIVNNGSASLALSGLSLHYYMTREGYVDPKLSVDYAAVGNGNVIGTFYDEYLEISFASGSVEPGKDSGEIQLRIEKVSNGYYVQTDDYSFDPSFTSFAPHNKVTCYRNGTLIWGVEPPPPPAPTQPPTPGNDWLHAEGGRICDSNGNMVRLTGINWFGFETNPKGLGGLHAMNWKDGFDLITSRGFNLVRLPVCLQIVRGWMSGKDPLVEFVSGELNPDIDGISSLTLLDKVVEHCKTVGIKIMLDMHALSTNVRTPLWFGDGYSLADLKAGWQWLADRYNNDDTIVAMDIYNEPHGQSWVDIPGTAKWDGSSDANNFRKAAEEIAQSILSRNPNLLIMVEGIECYPVEGASYGSSDKYQYLCNWWGGNLRGVRDYPVNIGSFQNKIVYSPHDYGPDIYVQPWFTGSFTLNSLYTECWQPNWFYIVEANIAPILIGEWGGKLGGDNQRWMEYLAQFISQEDLNHTFWALNPDSGDTGGILREGWNGVDESKYNIVRQSLWKNGSGKFIGLDHEVNLGIGDTGTNVAVYYGGSVPTPAPTSAPTTLPTSVPTSAPTNPSQVLLGDVNDDEMIDIIDALLTAQYYVGLNPANFDITAGDVNCSGSVDIIDALLISQYYVGLITDFC
ncbi:MAG: cellulase family glycosylhydrolase [Spirochaetales bacterium]|nr:cellulase family glycosylhydrolase [Spirochaetales bacterium]